MKRLLRSVIDVDGAIPQEDLVRNFQKIRESKLEWGRPEDDKVYKFIYQYFAAQLEMPALATINDYFSSLSDTEVTERLKDIQSAQFYIRTNYHYLLKTILEEQNKIKALTLLKESQEILARGLVINKERKFGIKDAFNHFLQKANDLVTPEFGQKTSGDIREDGKVMVEEYLTAETNKDKVWGKFCGIAEIDRNCRGAKRGELWVHAAFPGELKTTFGANWCYNLMTHYNTNVVYISLEMPREQVRRNIYTVHAANTKWEDQGYPALDYRAIRDGMLKPEEKDFYLNKVIPDFESNPHYRHFEVYTPDGEVNFDHIRMHLELLQKQFEVGFVVVDHGQWVEARAGKKNKEYGIELNTVVRDAKRLAMQFNGRQGIPVLLLWQINREGKDDADKNGGVYKAKALTYANEIEKTADVITTTYLNDQHRSAGTTLMANIKNRDNPIFAPFIAEAVLTTRRMRTVDKTRTSSGGMGVDAGGMGDSFLGSV